MVRLPHNHLTIIDARIEKPLLERHIRELAAGRGTLHILEAGCGQQWGLRLDGIRCVLTGVDLDEAALTARSDVRKNLDEAILGDLRTVSLAENAYDVIYSSFVLEHVSGAEQVMDKFLRWLKPGGLLILRVPDRQSVYGAVARLTPFWFHLLFKRFIAGCKEAGKPGVGPFPTAYDRIISRDGLRRWCDDRGLGLKAECGWSYPIARPGGVSALVAGLVKVLHALSLGSWADDHINLTYVIEKPAKATGPAAVEELQTQGAQP